MIKVVNKRSGEEGEYIGRPSPLGNPFTHLTRTKHAMFLCDTREESIRRYREWLEYHISEKTPEIMDEMQRLYDLSQEGDLNLVCWCKPLSCHGDILKEYLEQWEEISTV